MTPPLEEDRTRSHLSDEMEGLRIHTTKRNTQPVTTPFNERKSPVVVSDHTNPSKQEIHHMFVEQEDDKMSTDQEDRPTNPSYHVSIAPGIDQIDLPHASEVHARNAWPICSGGPVVNVAIYLPDTFASVRNRSALRASYTSSRFENQKPVDRSRSHIHRSNTPMISPRTVVKSEHIPKVLRPSPHYSGRTDEQILSNSPSSWIDQLYNAAIGSNKTSNRTEVVRSQPTRSRSLQFHVVQDYENRRRKFVHSSILGFIIISLIVLLLALPESTHLQWNWLRLIVGGLRGRINKVWGIPIDYQMLRIVWSWLLGFIEFVAFSTRRPVLL